MCIMVVMHRHPVNAGCGSHKGCMTRHVYCTCYVSDAAVRMAYTSSHHHTSRRHGSRITKARVTHQEGSGHTSRSHRSRIAQGHRNIWGLQAWALGMQNPRSAQHQGSTCPPARPRDSRFAEKLILQLQQADIGPRGTARIVYAWLLKQTHASTAATAIAAACQVTRMHRQTHLRHCC